MPASYRFTFLSEGRVQDFSGSRGNYYRLENGIHIRLHSAPVWCERCAKITHGENIDSIEEIDKQIADLERLAAEIRRDMTRPPLPTPDAPGDRSQQEEIAELKLRRAWRMRRRTPPRCLICGSTDIVVLEPGRTIRTSGGEIQCEFVGFCSTSFNMWYFSPEGDLIEKKRPGA